MQIGIEAAVAGLLLMPLSIRVHSIFSHGSCASWRLRVAQGSRALGSSESEVNKKHYRSVGKRKYPSQTCDEGKK
jgi:hypothetical protein